MAIDRDQLRIIRARVDAELAKLAPTLGLAKLSLGAATFDPTAGSFSFKLEGVMPGGKSAEAARYESCRSMLRLPPLNTTFKAQGSEHRIEGINSTGTKILARDLLKNKAYLWRTDAVRYHVEQQAKAVA